MQTYVKEQEECELCTEIEGFYDSPKREWTTSSIAVVGVSGALVAGILAVTTSFIAPAFRRVCVPYVPATAEQIRNLMLALRGRSGSLLDIGSGDGRVVIAASKEGFKSDGVELNYWLVLYSRLKAWREGQHKMTAFYRRDLWKTDISQYNNIVVFGTDPLMIELEKKFEREINMDCTILAARHPLPNWTHITQYGNGLESVWVYKHPDNTEFSVKAKPRTNVMDEAGETTNAGDIDKASDFDKAVGSIGETTNAGNIDKAVGSIGETTNAGDFDKAGSIGETANTGDIDKAGSIGETANTGDIDKADSVSETANTGEKIDKADTVEKFSDMDNVKGTEEGLESKNSGRTINTDGKTKDR